MPLHERRQVLALFLAGCTVDAVVADDSGLGTGGAAGSTGPAETGASADGSAATTDLPSSTTGDDSVKLDVGFGADLGRPEDHCKVTDDLDGVADCNTRAPADSFAPALEWSFGEGIGSATIPLVANLTDDNGDGAIDLCDTPDVVLVAGTGPAGAWLYGTCDLYVLDGATGTPHYVLDGDTYRIACMTTPALGDIDGDGLVEIVTGWLDPVPGCDLVDVAACDHVRLRAFEHDGTPKWASTGGDWVPNSESMMRIGDSVALHDLDTDGDVEIVFGHEVYDHDGEVLWHVDVPDNFQRVGSVGVDLDGDGLMEVAVGHAAYHHDGTVMWDLYPTIPTRSIPQVADLDGDPDPELFVTSGVGIFLVEHDGTIAYGPVTPTGVVADGYLAWQRPGTIHDFDGDGVAEWASSSREHYAVYQGPDATDMLWSSIVADISGAAGGTAFDFLGDGIAEAMYADETRLRVYDGMTGDVLLEGDRQSNTIFEYPIVADVDDDGSAEILVVSEPPQPALQVFRDAEDRWIPARRIWNQHAYYVTNVREDGTIPAHAIPPWQALNTYRTQAQIEDGGVCQPRPEG